MEQESPVWTCYLFPLFSGHVGQHQRENLFNFLCGVFVLSTYNLSVSEVIRVLDGDKLGQLQVVHYEVLLPEVVEAEHLFLGVLLAAFIPQLQERKAANPNFPGSITPEREGSWFLRYSMLLEITEVPGHVPVHRQEQDHYDQEYFCQHDGSTTWINWT